MIYYFRVAPPFLMADLYYFLTYPALLVALLNPWAWLVLSGVMATCLYYTVKPYEPTT
jgi:hypothetical protein